jgi:hypothetical protein
MAGGIPKKKKIDLSYFIDQGVASVRLNEIMQRESRPRTTISCASDHKLAIVKVGDTVQITSTEYSIDELFTVVQVSTSELNDLSINIDLEPRFKDLYDKNYVSVMASLGTLPSFAGNEVYEQLVFQKYSPFSNPKAAAFTDITKARVRFSAGQSIKAPKTWLVAGTDFAVVNNYLGVYASEALMLASGATIGSWCRRSDCRDRVLMLFKSDPTVLANWCVDTATSFTPPADGLTRIYLRWRTVTSANSSGLLSIDIAEAP